MNESAVWDQVRVPVVATQAWSRVELRLGLGKLERIRRELDAATALVIGGLGPEGRDTPADVARCCRVSPRVARQRVRTARVAGRVAGAVDALACGAVSTEHLDVLDSVTDNDLASSLLGVAAVESPEVFAATVMRARMAEGEDLSKKQRDSRFVRFRGGPDGCVGFHGLLPAIEGNEFRSVLRRLADEAGRREHPERAETLGGHGGEGYEQRLADALVTMMRGAAGGAPDDAINRSGSSSDSETGSGTSDSSGENSGGENVSGGGNGSGGRTAGSGGGGYRSGSGRPAVVVVVDIDKLEADLLGHGPVPFVDAMATVARAELYACIRGMNGAVLKFGRSRRFATAMQRLAVAVRDGGRCSTPGCDATWDRTEIHHRVPFEHGGLTDIDHLEGLCQNCHHHRHEQQRQRQRHKQRQRPERPRRRAGPRSQRPRHERRRIGEVAADPPDTS